MVTGTIKTREQLLNDPTLELDSRADGSYCVYTLSNRREGIHDSWWGSEVNYDPQSPTALGKIRVNIWDRKYDRWVDLYVHPYWIDTKE